MAECMWSRTRCSTLYRDSVHRSSTSSSGSLNPFTTTHSTISPLKISASFMTLPRVICGKSHVVKLPNYIFRSTITHVQNGIGRERSPDLDLNVGGRAIVLAETLIHGCRWKVRSSSSTFARIVVAAFQHVPVEDS